MRHFSIVTPSRLFLHLLTRVGYNEQRTENLLGSPRGAKHINNIIWKT